MIHMEKRIAKIEEKLDQLVEIAIKNTVVLEEHQRRSLALEDHVKILEKEVAPIRDHVKFITLLVKIIAPVFAIAVALKELGVIKLF